MAGQAALPLILNVDAELNVMEVRVDRFEFFSGLPRSTPGAATFTSALITPLPIKATDQILDLGCGAGGRATWIARSRGCRVVVLDDDRRFLPVALERAKEGGAGDLMVGLSGSYTDLPFCDQSFSVVLADGPALGLGWRRALMEWRRLLPMSGHLVVTYPGVVNKDAPDEVRGQLERHMVEPLGTLAEYHAAARGAGYEVVHQVSLSPLIWDAYYRDLVRHAWALVSSGVVDESDPFISGQLEEAEWYKRAGRGRIFMQGFLLRRVR